MSSSPTTLRERPTANFQGAVRFAETTLRDAGRALGNEVMTDTPNDNESGRALEKYPPPERLVAAFLKATGRRDDEGGETEPQTPPQKNGSPPGSVESTDGEVPPNRERMPFEGWVEETLIAFRLAGGTVWHDKSDNHSQTSNSGGMVSKRGSLESSKALPAPVESSEGTGKDTESSREPGNETVWPEVVDPATPSEDLALAFRQAFYRRRVRHETANQADSADKTPRTASFPPRPATSFLWVTAGSQANSRSIAIQNLSGIRARRAGAFLLCGKGEEPYRLLRRIRHNPDPLISLKPVFWRSGADQASPVSDHVDGTWTPQSDREALRTLRERAATINRRIRAVVEREEEAGGERRLLHFVATRSNEFAPRRRKGGIVYPKLTPLVGGSRGEGQ